MQRFAQAMVRNVLYYEDDELAQKEAALECNLFYVLGLSEIIWQPGWQLQSFPWRGGCKPLRGDSADGLRQLRC